MRCKSHCVLKCSIPCHLLRNYLQCIRAICRPEKWSGISDWSWIATTDEARDLQRKQRWAFQAGFLLQGCASTFRRCLVCNTHSAFIGPCTLTIRLLGILSRPSGLHAERRCSLECTSGCHFYHITKASATRAVCISPCSLWDVAGDISLGIL